MIIDNGRIADNRTNKKMAVQYRLCMKTNTHKRLQSIRYKMDIMNKTIVIPQLLSIILA